jgi:hypothetical protein
MAFPAELSLTQRAGNDGVFNPITHSSEVKRDQPSTMGRELPNKS